jgi:hypothetical protein
MIKVDKPVQQSVADVFAANVELLMRMYRDPGQRPPTTAVTSRRLAVPALTRIVRKPRYETVETLELLAEVFRRNVPGLEAWMLLYPNLDPQHLPICVADHERDLLRRIRTFTAKQPAHVGKLSSSRAQGG